MVRGFDFGNPVSAQSQHPGMWNLANANLEVHRKLEEFHKGLEERIKKEKESANKKAQEEKKVEVKEARGEKFLDRLKSQKGIIEENARYAEDNRRHIQEKEHMKNRYERLLEESDRKFEREATANYNLSSELSNFKVQLDHAFQENQEFSLKVSRLESQLDQGDAMREDLFQENMSLKQNLQDRELKIWNLSNASLEQGRLLKEKTDAIESMRSQLESKLESNALVPFQPYELGRRDPTRFIDGDIPSGLKKRKVDNEYVDLPDPLDDVRDAKFHTGMSRH